MARWCHHVADFSYCEPSRHILGERADKYDAPALLLAGVTSPGVSANM